MPLGKAQAVLLRRLNGLAAIDEKDIKGAADLGAEAVDRMLLL
jgi:hypothetical protein